MARWYWPGGAAIAKGGRRGQVFRQTWGRGRGGGKLGGSNHQVKAVHSLLVKALEIIIDPAKFRGNPHDIPVSQLVGLVQTGGNELEPPGWFLP
jgi:hypothetical protein